MAFLAFSGTQENLKTRNTQGFVRRACSEASKGMRRGG